MLDFVPLVAMGALVSKLVDFLKYLTARDYRPAVTQAIAWLAGWAVVALAAASSFADAIPVGDLTLGRLGAADLLLVGTTVSSGISVVYDFKKAVDNTDSAAVPPLGGDVTPRG